MKVGNIQSKQPSELRTKHGLVLLNMGPPRNGKTTMIRTLYDTEEHAKLYGPVGLADCDGNAHVLEDSPHLHVYDATSFDAAIKLSEGIAARCEFKTWVWDGIANLQAQSHIHYGIQTTKEPRLVYGPANISMSKISQQAKILAEFGTNVIFNVWSKPETLDPTGDGMLKIMPDLTASLLRDFVGLIDFIVYTECAPKIIVAGKQVQDPYPPIMRTGGSSSYGTGSRVSPDSPLRDMPDIIYNPSLASILDSFHGEPWPTDKHKKPTYTGAST